MFCRCFDPDPDLRATAPELLDHPFLAEWVVNICFALDIWLFEVNEQIQSCCCELFVMLKFLNGFFFCPVHSKSFYKIILAVWLDDRLPYCLHGKHSDWFLLFCGLLLIKKGYPALHELAPMFFRIDNCWWCLTVRNLENQSVSTFIAVERQLSYPCFLGCLTSCACFWNLER